MTTRIKYFRPRVPGPELAIEDAVVDKLGTLFLLKDWPMWVGGSLPIGSGRPDVVSVLYQPAVVSLAAFERNDCHILAYLKHVRAATPVKIASQVPKGSTPIDCRLSYLESLNIVDRPSSESFSLSKAWRDILPQIVTVEAKVSDWRTAIAQAVRNRVVAHRSFVALPEKTAARVVDDPAIAFHGIGVLGVTNSEEIVTIKEARRNRPRVWQYYFHVAGIVAKDIKEREYDLQLPHR